jgi:capsular polysaccharide biosynthesis protein
MTASDLKSAESEMSAINPKGTNAIFLARIVCLVKGIVLTMFRQVVP